MSSRPPSWCTMLMSCLVRVRPVAKACLLIDGHPTTCLVVDELTDPLIIGVPDLNRPHFIEAILDGIGARRMIRVINPSPVPLISPAGSKHAEGEVEVKLADSVLVPTPNRWSVTGQSRAMVERLSRDPGKAEQY